MVLVRGLLSNLLRHAATSRIRRLVDLLEETSCKEENLGDKRGK